MSRYERILNTRSLSPLVGLVSGIAGIPSEVTEDYIENEEVGRGRRGLTLVGRTMTSDLVLWHPD